MIYYCEKCRLLFSRSGEADACADCGSANVRQADEQETKEYKNRLEQPDRVWSANE